MSETTLCGLAETLGLEWSGNGDLVLTHACGLDALGTGGLAYLTDPKGLGNVPVPEGSFKRTRAALDDLEPGGFALLVPPSMRNDAHPLIYAEDPLEAHVRATRLLHPAVLPPAGIHPTAVVGEGVELDENVAVGPHVVLYDRVRIGAGTVLHAGVAVMSDVMIGTDCMLHPNVVIESGCELGNRVEVQSGAVIGADGHGYFQRKGVNHKIPQVGKVRIEDDVEIGANTTVDRARFRTTMIGAGSKLDNQVQIAHNVELGAQALVSAQTAIGGSVRTGHHLILGGQTGIRDNVVLGDHVTVAARGVVTSNTPEKSVIGGMPGRPLDQWRRIQSLINRLEELFERVKRLETNRKEEA
jgi:UDP-3-O-[3-hydroxymyristoyl] glucosamine N-acyltransferase